MTVDISVVIPWRQESTTRIAAQRFVVARALSDLLPAEVILGKSDQEPFNRSQARNDGIARARGEYIVLLDADLVFPPNWFTDALLWACTKPWVLPYNTYRQLTELGTARLLGRASGMSASLRAEGIADSENVEQTLIGTATGHPVAPAGCVVARKQNLVPFNEGFRGWGYEDDEWYHRQVQTFGLPHIMEGLATHLWHPRPEGDFAQPYIDENRQLLEERNDPPSRDRTG